MRKGMTPIIVIAGTLLGSAMTLLLGPQLTESFSRWP